MSTEMTQLTRALVFAAEAHANQRRKGAAQEPYINHLLEVLDLVTQATNGDDIELLIAALLHDVIEDTAVTHEDLKAAFGERVLCIVTENSDDMSLPKNERRQQRIAAMPHKSTAARIVKIADLISNLRAMAVSPPAGWGKEHKLSYLEGCRQLVDAGRGANAVLESKFDHTVADAERAIRHEGDFAINGRKVTERHLESAIGQSVYLVYLPNTECREFDDRDIDKLCTLSARSFPSLTVQMADAIYDGRRRPILLARIRTDSSDAVVELAQRLCLAFNQRFVGIEVSGHYIRVYADDTA